MEGTRGTERKRQAGMQEGRTGERKTSKSTGRTKEVNGEREGERP